MEEETFFLLICLAILAGGSSEKDFAVDILLEPGQYSDFPHNCTRIKDFASEKAIREISSALLKNNVSSAWLPLKRRRFDVWIWLSNTTYGKSISDPGWVIEGYDCAILRAGDRIIDDVPCSRTFSNFICETKAKNCSDITKGYKCLKHEGKNYVIYSKQMYTWYMAKQHCFEQNMTLASFLAKDEKQIMEKVAVELGFYEKVWIGLRKAEYMTDHGSKVYSYRNHFSWATGSPCVCPYKECVAIINGAWQPQNCTSVHHFLCYAKDKEGKSLKRESSPAGSHGKVAIIVSSFLFILAGALVTTFIVYKRKQSSNINSNCQEKESMLNKDERIPLTSTAQRIRNEILKPNSLNKESLNILVIGLAGAGKSSLSNSLIAALDKDGFREWFRAGSYGKEAVKGQISMKLRHFTLFQNLDDPTKTKSSAVGDSNREEHEELSYKLRPTLWDCPGLLNDASDKSKRMLDLILKGTFDEEVVVPDYLFNDKDLPETPEEVVKQNQKMDVILFVHPADKPIPDNLLRLADMQVVGKQGQKEIPVIFVLNKKDLVRETQKRNNIINEACSKLGLIGSDRRSFVVSSYSEHTKIKNKNRNKIIDEDMCQIWCKLLSPEMYALT